nr:collagen triple helix repeat domain protein [Pithovirus mammoth]
MAVRILSYSPQTGERHISQENNLSRNEGGNNQVPINYRGYTGATGPKGDCGRNGCTGPKGNDGKNGKDGCTGPKGNDGKNGKDGCTGATGPKGDCGKDGCTGPTGPKGDCGKDGCTGPKGADGKNGRDGCTGPKGDQGLIGCTGLKGDTGPKGDCGKDGCTGPKGTDGKDGCTGPTGPKGADGKNGCTGPKGTDGKDGCTGPTGPKGADGKNGCTGPAGERGPMGSTGPGGPGSCVGTNRIDLRHPMFLKGCGKCPSLVSSCNESGTLVFTNVALGPTDGSSYVPTSGKISVGATGIYFISLSVSAFPHSCEGLSTTVELCALTGEERKLVIAQLPLQTIHQNPVYASTTALFHLDPSIPVEVSFSNKSSAEYDMLHSSLVMFRIY